MCELLRKLLVGLTSLHPSFGTMNINAQSNPLRVITGEGRHWDSQNFAFNAFNEDTPVVYVLLLTDY